MRNQLDSYANLNKKPSKLNFLIVVEFCIILVSCTSQAEPIQIYIATKTMTLSTEEGGIITSVAFSPDGETVAAGTTLGKAILWKTSDGTIKHTLKAHWCCRVYDVAFSPDGNFLATGAPLDRVLIWKVSDGTLIQKLRGGGLFGSGVRHMTSVAYSPDGTTVAAGAYDGSTILWRSSDGTIQHSFPFYSKGSIHSLDFSPDGTQLAVGVDKTLWSLQVDEWKPHITAEDIGETIIGVAYAPNGDIIAAGGMHGNTSLINASDGSVIHTFPTKRGNAVWDLGFSPDGRNLAIGTRDGKVRIWCISDMSLLYVIETAMGEISIAYAPDGQALAIGMENGTVELWSIPDKSEFQQ